MCKECEELRKELARSEAMLKFKENEFEQMFINKAKDLDSRVEHIIGLELEGIEIVANRLPESRNLEKDQERLLRYLRRIRERIAEISTEYGR